MSPHKENKHLVEGIRWFSQFIESDEWKTRRQKIVESIHDTVNITPDGIMRPFTHNEDLFGWYLFQAESYLESSYYYDFAQGSRIIPYFISVGENTNHLKHIINSEDKSEKIAKNKINPDSGLFELLVATLYKKNDYDYVELLDEVKNSKTPDILAKNSEEVFIECKRLSKISTFSLNEREHWLRLWRPISNYITKNKIQFFITILFRDCLHKYSDSYLEELLLPKLQLLPPRATGVILDNEHITIHVEPIDMGNIRRETKSNYTRANSPSLIKMITGEYIQYSNYNIIIECTKHPEIPTLIDTISFAAGAKWLCTAEEATTRKSRHIKKKFSEATSQIPNNKHGVIHLGIEAIEGDEIEQLRFARSFLEISHFDTKHKDIQWIYYHILAPGTSPEEDWFFEETVSFFEHKNTCIDKLQHTNIMSVENIKNGFSWDYRE